MSRSTQVLTHQGLAYKLVTLGLLLVGLAVLLLVATRVLMSPEFLTLDDYVEYWSAARLNLKGGNPYNPDQMEALQRQIGRVEQVPIMMWNPPWTLAVVIPISLFSYPVSRFLWLLLNVSILMWCADWLWTFYGGPSHRRWIAWFAVFTFAPPLHAFKAGQISPLLLLGIVGFLCLVSQGRDGAAGAVLVLATFKPHLVYLVGIAVVLWAVSYRRWRVLLGGLAALAMAMGIVWAANPALVSQYRYALTHYPPQQWATPTLGGVLRLILGPDRFWLQFAPSVFGAVWLVLYWMRHRIVWRWRERLPLIVLVSVLTAAYGWTFDHTVMIVALLPAVLALSMSTWQTRGIRMAALLGSYVVVNGLALFSSMDQIWYWWQAPFFLVWYLLAMRVAADGITERSAKRDIMGGCPCE